MRSTDTFLDLVQRALRCRDVGALMVKAAFCLAFMLVLFAPMLAEASVTGGGGGMPYSTGLQTFNTSARTEVAGILIVLFTVCAVATYLFGGQLTGVMEMIGKGIIGISIIGGVASFAVLAGVTGAVV